MSEVKSVPLEQKHISLGARMIPFAGWNMPVQYPGGILAEHFQTRERVSLFDCSHMGQFRIRGKNVVDDLDSILPRCVSSQKIDSCRYNFLLTSDGTVRDDIIVYRLATDEIYIVVNAGTIAEDSEYIKANLSADTEFLDESAATVKLDVQGPMSGDVMTRVGFPESEIPKYFRCNQTRINTIPCLISRTGYTGELGFELYLPKEHAVNIWDLIMEHPEIRPAGLGARDTLRLEMGYPLYGHELNLDTTPVEAGFKNMLNLEHQFTGRDALLLDPKKALVGIRFAGRRAFRADTCLYNEDGEEVGTITSGSYSPSLACSIAMGYVDVEYGGIGDNVFASVRDKHVPGEIVNMPFYKDGTVRRKI